LWGPHAYTEQEVSVITKSASSLYHKNIRGTLKQLHGKILGRGYCAQWEPSDISAHIGDVLRYYYSGMTFSDGTITYDVGKQKFNYCMHTRTWFELAPAVPLAYLTRIWSGSLNCYVNYLNLALDGYGGPNQSTATLPLAPPLVSVEQSWRKEAWSELIPQFNDGLSLFNFILELADLRSLLKAAMGVGKTIRALINPRDLGKTPADVLLTYSFGIAPLVDDVAALFDIFFNMDKRINEFIAKGRENQSYHFRKMIDESTTVISTQKGVDLIESNKTQYFATLKGNYTYNLPNIWQAYKRALGYQPTAERIWNAIPWSFTLDWAIKIADFLKQFDKDPAMRFTIKDYCDTIKVTRTRRLQVTKDYQPTYNGGEFLYYVPGYDYQFTHPIWETGRSIYYRQPDSPNTGYALPVLDTLSNRELVLGGALLRTL